MYTRLYKQPADRLPDSERFRVRLLAALEEREAYGAQIADELRGNWGLELDSFEGYNGMVYAFDDFVRQTPIDDLLDTIKAVFDAIHGFNSSAKAAASWRNRVRQIISEEKLAYRIDDDCVVHPFIDQQFERYRVAAIEALGAEKFRAVREYFERAISELEERPPRTRTAVRYCFEAAETLFKLSHAGGKDLSKNNVERELRPLVAKRYLGMDASANGCAAGLVSSFGDWVDAGHKYRHGVGDAEPHDPPLELAVVYLGSGASHLRWLATIVDASEGS